ncbi:MAG: hypothetical protein ACRD3J_00135, partial [Thermoanaerobaculia bacterium]
LHVSAGAISAVCAGYMLVVFRIAISSRRRRQLFRLVEESSSKVEHVFLRLLVGVHRLMVEAPETADETSPHAVNRAR